MSLITSDHDKDQDILFFWDRVRDQGVARSQQACPYGSHWQLSEESTVLWSHKSQQIWRHGDGFNPKWRDEIVIAIGFLLAQTYSLAIENGRENMMMVGGNQERAKGLNILAPSLSASYSNL